MDSFSSFLLTHISFNHLIFSSLYTYDSTEQFLVTVTIGTSSATYTYNEQGDLTSISYSSGGRRTFQYNSNGLYAGSMSYSKTGELTASVNLTHSWNGRLEMTVQPRNQTLDVLYDFSGRILSVTGKDGVPLVQVDFPRGQRILSGDEVSLKLLLTIVSASFPGLCKP